MDLSDLTYEHFAGRVGEVFRTRYDGVVVELTLTGTQQSTGQQSGNTFTLIFAGSTVPHLNQHIYELKHADLGTLAIFLVPVAKEKDRTLYEAVFNRLPED